MVSVIKVQYFNSDLCQIRRYFQSDTGSLCYSTCNHLDLYMNETRIVPSSIVFLYIFPFFFDHWE